MTLTRRTVLSLFSAAPFAHGATAAGEAVSRYWQTLLRGHGRYAWPDDPKPSLSVTYSAVASHQVLGKPVPHAVEVARFVRGAYPMPPARRKDRPLHRFDFEQMQTLAWLGESIEEYRDAATGWDKPSYFTKNYEMHENPVLRQETGAILCRKLLGLPATEDWKTYVRLRRRKNGSFNHTPAQDGTDGHVTNTLWGLQANHALNVAVDDREQTIAWIQHCQQSSGGFTYAPAAKLAAVDHVDYIWAALLALQQLGGKPADVHGAENYLLSLWNDDGGFGDRPGRASNPQATQQALEALASLAAMNRLEGHQPTPRPAKPALPSNLRIFSMQIEAPGTGSPREAAEMAAALKINLWGAKNCAPGWISRAQQIAGESNVPVLFLPANEEYGTYVDVPGLGTYSHLADVNAPPGVDFGLPLSDKDRQPNDWQTFLQRRVAPLRQAGGSNVWQFNENEELTRVLLNQAVEEGTFSAISAFHFGSENFLETQPFLNRYRDVLPFIGLQDAHTATWWWMEFLVAFRTFYLAEQPTWAGWQKALRENWIVSVRHDSRTDFKTQLAGGSDTVRRHLLERQAQWRWWTDKPEELIRPAASLVAVTPDERFEEARPTEGVNLRLRCWMDTQPFGVPKIPVYELASFWLDAAEVKPEHVRVEPKAGDRGDEYHWFHVPADRKGAHTATATVRNVKTGELQKVTRKFSV